MALHPRWLIIYHLVEDHFNTLETDLNSDCGKHTQPDLSSKNMPDSECEGRESLQLMREGMFGAVRGRYGDSCSQKSVEFSFLSAEERAGMCPKIVKGL